jgi:hypothetical protein
MLPGGEDADLWAQDSLVDPLTGHNTNARRTSRTFLLLLGIALLFIESVAFFYIPDPLHD